MKFQLKFILGVSLMLMALSVFMGFTGNDSFLSKRVFFIFTGILGWFIGNQLVDFDSRLKELEQPSDEGKSNPNPDTQDNSSVS